MSTLTRGMEDHRYYGHDVFALGALLDQMRSRIFIWNVCNEIRCSKKDEHIWERATHKNQPCLRCLACGFIWKTDMRKPKVTCEQILAKKNRGN